MIRIVIFLALLLGSVFARFESSSESCEDSSHGHGDGYGYGGGGGGHGHPPHNGGGNNNGGCGTGWKRLNRPTGGWCIRVFMGELTQAEAENKCQAEGATLSGLQDSNEINLITQSALPLLAPRTSASLWIGLKRTPTCSGSPISASCNAMNSFYWTDSFTSGTAGIIWNHRQPDNAHARTQQCAVLLASSTPTVVDIWTWYANRLDDVACVNPGGRDGRIVRGYVCGKTPRTRR